MVRVEAPGFRPLESKGNVLAAAGRLALGKLQLEVGSVTRIGAGDRADRAGGHHHDGAGHHHRQQADGTDRGQGPRSDVGLQDAARRHVIADQDTWGGSFQSTVPTFQGRGGNTVYTDGVNGGDGGGGGNFSGITSIDAIAEVNIQANSYTAEYGFKGGAQVNMVTKHGGSEFHGTAAYYKRHEQFNAQNLLQQQERRRQAALPLRRSCRRPSAARFRSGSRC